MSLITDLSQPLPNILTFTLNNGLASFKPSFVNAIRRVLTENIEVYTMDPTKTHFFENTSIFKNNDSFLSHRLQLIPIRCDMKDVDYDNLVISCKKMNDSDVKMSVYPIDFVCKVGDKIIPSEEIFPYPQILFTVLKMNQHISFESRLIRKNAEEGGAFYEPLSTCVFTNKIDEKKCEEMTSTMSENEKRSFYTQENQRVFEVNKNGDPNGYCFRLESIQFYLPNQLFLLALDILTNKLTTIKTEIRNPNSHKVYIQINKENEDFIDIYLNGETDTIGNLLATYLTSEKDVFYAGYIIEHPLKKIVKFKIRLIENNSVENIIEKFVGEIEHIQKLINDVKNEFEKLF